MNLDMGNLDSACKFTKCNRAVNSLFSGHLFDISVDIFGEVIVNGLRIKYRNIIGESTRVGTATANKEAIITSSTISTTVVTAEGGTRIKINKQAHDFKVTTYLKFNLRRTGCVEDGCGVSGEDNPTPDSEPVAPPLALTALKLKHLIQKFKSLSQ